MPIRNHESCLLYTSLAGVVTDEMAEVALSMKVRVPATAEAVSYTHLDVYKRQSFKRSQSSAS